MKFAFENCIMDTDARELQRDGAPVPIEPKAFLILQYLIENKDRALSKDELLAEIWNGRIVSDSALSSAVKAARAAVGDDGAKQSLIKTIHGHGFRFVGHAVAMVDARSSSPPSDLVQDIQYCRSTDGTNIAYALTGHGPELVRPAHWMSHLEYDLESPIWRPWIQMLGQNHRYLRYDQRGNGLSDRAPDDLSFDAMMQDLEQVIEAAGFERFVLFGLSGGASISIEYAARYPERVRAMVLCGGFAKGWRHREDAEELARREAMTELMRVGWGQNNPAFRQMFTSMFLPDADKAQTEWFNEIQHRSVDPEMAARIHEASGELDVVHRLEKIRTPTLVIHARDDAVVPLYASKAIAARIPNARLVTLESKNHILLSKEPAFQRLLDEMERFLEQHP